jgi:hypothetical protein
VVVVGGAMLRRNIAYLKDMVQRSNLQALSAKTF